MIEKKEKLVLNTILDEASLQCSREADESFYHWRNRALLTTLMTYNPSLIAFDAPFALPSVLIGDDECYYPLEDIRQKELQNPYLFDNSARFVYEKTGLKVMAPAGDSIGKLTARMMHLKRCYPEIAFVTTPHISADRIEAIEVYPKATLKQLIQGKVPSYKGAKFVSHKREMLSVISPYFEATSLEGVIHSDDDFDAVVAALSAYFIAAYGFVQPVEDQLSYFSNSFIFIPECESIKQ